MLLASGTKVSVGLLDSDSENLLIIQPSVSDHIVGVVTNCRYINFLEFTVKQTVII